MGQEGLSDFGQEIMQDESFFFECRPGLSCFGRCCKTEVSLTPYDIARLRTHLGLETETFLSTYVTTRADRETGFPCAVLKKNAEGRCMFSQNGGCRVYDSRPSCCRGYPLSRVVDEDRMTGKRLVGYRLQKGADYCEGLGRGQEWAVREYCDSQGLDRYDRANDLFLDIVFEFYGLPVAVRHDRDVQQMIYGVVFNFDRFFDEYGHFPHTSLPEGNDELMEHVRTFALRLIERVAEIKLNE